ncbi:MAG: glycosyltransferase [Syntrophobacteraceae bacterium]
MDTPPSISLCMIVKNEEHYLPGCLSSAAPYVNEIVVVDTGSSDRTVEIAQTFGARVYHFEWINDFSAARNESLRHATGDWVLQLDADERLNLLGSPEALKEAASASGVDAYVVLIRCHHREGSHSTYSVNHNLRFFRRLPGIRYEREVHESVELFLRRAGAATANASFMIEHEGYDVSGSTLTRKLERNLAILQQYVQRSPDDPYGLYYLGNTYKAMGRDQESLQALELSLQQEGAPESLKAMTLNAMNLTYLATGDFNKTIETSEKSLQIVPNQNTARYFLGAAFFNKKQYQESLPHLLSCYQYWSRPPKEKTTSITQEYTMSERDLLKSITICLANLNHYPKAIFYAKTYLILDNEDAHIHHILGLIFTKTGDHLKALQHLDLSVQLGLNYEIAGIPIAFSYLKLGDPDRCVEHFARIRESDPGAVDESFRLLLLIVQTREAFPQLPGLLSRKKHLIQQASFEQLGQLASCLARNDQLDALKVLLESIHERPAEVESLLGGLVEYFAEQGRSHHLLPVLEDLAKRHPGQTAFLSACGHVCIKARDFFRAIEVYRRLHDLEPESPTIARTLAGLYVSVGNEAQALQIFRRNQSGTLREIARARGSSDPNIAPYC